MGVVMRTAIIGALILGLAAAGLGMAQSLPKPAVPSNPTPLERFVNWVRTPPRAAAPRRRDGALPLDQAVTSAAAPLPSTSPAPAAPLPSQPANAAGAMVLSSISGDPPAPPAPGQTLPPMIEAPPPPQASKWPRVSATPTARSRTSTAAVPPPIPGPPPDESAPLTPIPAPHPEPEAPPSQLPPPTPLPPEVPRVTTSPIALEPTLDFNDEAFVYDSPGMFWTSAEYLIWRTEHAPLGYPMTTSSLVGVGTGAVGSNGAVIFFDKGSMSYPTYSGMRLTAGVWLDSCERTGLEASGFFLNTNGIHFKSVASATQPSLSGPAGPQGPISIYLPYINSVSGAASAQTIGAQAYSQGFINIDSTSNLNGVELNIVRNLFRGPLCRLELLGGYRYLNLKETLNLTANTNASGTTTALTSPQQFLIMDNFQTRSQFNGAQLGGRIYWTIDHFTCTVSGRLALGVTQESGSIAGGTTFFSSANPITAARGFYAQPSNIGTYSRDQFAAVPQLGITLGYQAGRHCRFYMGYDFLYWTRVVRPGDMVNPLINPAGVVSNPSFTGATTGGPAPLFPSRDFFATGVNMGLEVKY
jgi:hypothetical protein